MTRTSAEAPRPAPREQAFRGETPGVDALGPLPMVRYQLWQKLGLALGAAALMWIAGGFSPIGLQSSAHAVAEEEADGYTTSFSSLRDPKTFSAELSVVPPKPVIPMNRSDAVAQELLYRTRTLTETEAMQVAHALVEEADSLGYDPLIYLALIRIESNYNHLAISPVGAEGLMQLMPPTAAWMAEREGVEWPERHSFDPVLNVRLGARYLAHLNRQFKGRMDHALTAYNRGPSATQYLIRKYGDLPREIRDFYATKVLDKYQELRGMYGHLPAS